MDNQRFTNLSLEEINTKIKTANEFVNNDTLIAFFGFCSILSIATLVISIFLFQKLTKKQFIFINLITATLFGAFIMGVIVETSYKSNLPLLEDARTVKSNELLKERAKLIDTFKYSDTESVKIDNVVSKEIVSKELCPALLSQGDKCYFIQFESEYDLKQTFVPLNEKFKFDSDKEYELRYYILTDEEKDLFILHNSLNGELSNEQPIAIKHLLVGSKIIE